MDNDSPDSVSRGDLIQILADSETPSTVIKQDQRSRVTVVDSLGSQWIVKTYNIQPAKRFLYGLVNLTPALREARGSRLLYKSGIRCARISGVIWHQDKHTHESIIMPMIPGNTMPLYLQGTTPSYDTATRRQRAVIATAIGQQVGRMIASNIVNRDLKPSNLMLDEQALTGQAAPVILDPAGVSRRRSDSQTYRMIARLHHSVNLVAPASRTEVIRCLNAILIAANLMSTDSPKADRHRTIRRWIRRIESATASLR